MPITLREGRYWVALDGAPSGEGPFKAIEKLLLLLNKPAFLFPDGKLTHFFRGHSKLQELSSLTTYQESPTLSNSKSDKSPLNKQVRVLQPHLARLEAESIFIFGEALAQAKNPVMLYSISKDSSVMPAGLFFNCQLKKKDYFKLVF